MSRASRTALIGVACIAVIAAPSFANAALLQSARSIKTTQRITTLSSTAQSATNVGTSDGNIAGTRVHGALRATSSFTTPSTFTASGTLFYPAGTLRYNLHGTATRNPDGSLTISASGTFTGGSGKYLGAQGHFNASGAKPANSFETWTLSGKVRSR